MVQVVLIQSFLAKQNCLSKHLDRTSTGPGLEQIHRLNSLLVFHARDQCHFVVWSICSSINMTLVNDLESLNCNLEIELHNEKTYFFAYVKTKMQISCAVNAYLISAFVFTK